uniref:Uncharacterized protein n=1 Tax=Picea glauca TaxID=3330 RepID=A0A117NGP9_PICGL|nr:hypothetical protein ABT39_MTgene6156 [Picea glauca]QHR88787.1 hypothetical protein Q903MT_gene2802 [Picea sitchensis]
MDPSIASHSFPIDCLFLRLAYIYIYAVELRSSICLVLAPVGHWLSFDTRPISFSLRPAYT